MPSSWGCGSTTPCMSPATPTTSATACACTSRSQPGRLRRSVDGCAASFSPRGIKDDRTETTGASSKTSISPDLLRRGRSSCGRATCSVRNSLPRPMRSTTQDRCVSLKDCGNGSGFSRRATFGIGMRPAHKPTWRGCWQTWLSRGTGRQAHIAATPSVGIVLRVFALQSRDPNPSPARARGPIRPQSRIARALQRPQSKIRRGRAPVRHCHSPPSCVSAMLVSDPAAAPMTSASTLRGSGLSLRPQIHSDLSARIASE